MSTLVVATKLFTPARRVGVVARPRLRARLEGTLARGHRLTLVSAPAGFGKTTLLSDWVAGQELVGWVSLDEADNALPRFFAHVWAALAGIGLELDPAALDAAALDAAVPTSATVTAVVNEIVRAGQERPDSHWLLVLDDYHVIETPEIHEAMAFLLDHAPDQLHLLVTTRSDPPFALSRLRSRGQLIEVRAADLRFESAEAREFLNELMGLELTETDVQALEERTEGWIAGLQLAALSLRGMSERGDVVDFIGAFTGSHRFVIDYLVDEVLARQTADVRAFLLRTAILDRLTGSLCDAVTGGTDGSRQLDELDRGNVFVVPLDAERSWYRYHHLFGDVLRARLTAEQPEQVPALHRAATAWYAEHELMGDAVRHALAAGDHDRAAYLIEAALPAQRRARQDNVLLGWIRPLPDSVVKRSPVLSILAGWSLMMAGDLDGMERRLDDADAALAAGARDPVLAATWADTEDLRTAPAAVWVYRAALAQARGDVPATVLHARRAWDLAETEDHFVRGAAGGYLGLAAWAAGDVEQALSTFGAAVRSLHAAGNLTDELDCTVVLGDMWRTAGRPDRARRLYEQALAGVSEPYPRATADLHVGLAELDLELGDLVSAEAHLETAKVLAERGSITENRHRWYVVMAQVRVLAEDYPSARQLLDRAEELYRPGFYLDLRPLAAIRARVELAAGDLAAVEEWARDHNLSTDDEVSFLHEYEHLTLVRLLLATRTSLVDALALLDRLHVDAEGTRAGSLAEIDLLREQTRQLLGQPDRSALPDPLSERELEVLRLLGSELTGPEIARHLFVSLNTLRTHTKRIFTKLDVNNRAAATRRGRELGLL
ncbi:LuxR C-terminal-related transcriptional regulator [Kribbella sp. NPDC051952]|uniref:LuxR C-terminal-related transcriptional regulator n=1 Tax=Kribbella sp. NPDC051952 TaxID=3154851 RepID=UPI00342DF909